MRRDLRDSGDLTPAPVVVGDDEDTLDHDEVQRKLQLVADLMAQLHEQDELLQSGVLVQDDRGGGG